MKFGNISFYRSIVFVIWLLLLSYVFTEYKRLKDLDIPITVLDFDIALHQVTGTKARGVFYFDTGDGFNKDEVAVFPYVSQKDNDFQRYSVSLTTHKEIKRLRFDPLDNSGKVTIKDLTVRKYNDKRVSFSQQVAESNEKNAIENIDVTPDSITVTANGDDPHFVLVDDFSEYQQ